MPNNKQTQSFVESDPFNTEEPTGLVPLRPEVIAIPDAWKDVPSLADIIPDAPVIKAAEIEGQPFLVQSVQYLRGMTPDGQESEYVAFCTVMLNGEEGFVTCGGQEVVRKMRQFDKLAEQGLVSYPVRVTLQTVPLGKGKKFWKVI